MAASALPVDKSLFYGEAGLLGSPVLSISQVVTAMMPSPRPGTAPWRVASIQGPYSQRQ